MGDFAGKRAIVFGGTSGINLGIAMRLADEGARVFLVSRSQDKVDEAVAASAQQAAKRKGTRPTYATTHRSKPRWARRPLAERSTS